MSKKSEFIVEAEEENTNEESELTDEIDNEVVAKKLDQIASAIDKFVFRALDISFSATTFIPKAAKWKIDNLNKYYKEMQKNILLLEDTDEITRVVAFKNFIEADFNIKRIDRSDIVRVLEVGHFLSLFSAFDAFTGELISAIYNKKPVLFKNINRSLSVSEMLEYENIEDVKSIILKNEIESFRRESYIKQFEILETRFSINLRKFKKWHDFVECSQRRNIITHCDGIISEQYINICKKEGCQFSNPIKPGDVLKITPKYLINSCILLIEVAIKLGQTLWRDQFQDEIREADEHLHILQYDFLKRNNYDIAIMVGEFAYNLPKHSDETIKIIMLINQAIACKFIGNEENAISLLNKRDFGPLCNDFKLAESVLRDEFIKASEIMIKIGKRGEFIHEQAYHEWPLFKKFRETVEFQNAYNEVYGHPFVTELKRTVTETKIETESEIAKTKDELIDNENVTCRDVEE